MALKLHDKGFAYAQKLIQGGLEVEVKECNWSAHKATADEVDKFVETHNIGEYAQWFLATDPAIADPNNLARYQLPFGDLKIVHKSAIIEAQKQAAQKGAKDVEEGAKKLLQMIAQIKR